MFYKRKFLKFGFTLAEMMVVMLILSIILAASMPVITKRKIQQPQKIVEKIITIQVPYNSSEKNNSNINFSTVSTTNETSIDSQTYSQEVTNIEMLPANQNEESIPQAKITVKSGKQFTINLDDNGYAQLKELNTKK